MGKSDKSEIFHSLSLFFQLGISMACCVFVGVWIGRFLDQKLGTAPWLLVVFAFIGGGAAFKVMYDTVIQRWMKK